MSAPFYGTTSRTSSQTWQVRSEFDQMMLVTREHGVAAHEGVRVFHASRATAPWAKIRNEDGSFRDVRAKVVVDASGQVGLIESPRLRVWDPGANKGRDLTY